MGAARHANSDRFINLASRGRVRIIAISGLTTPYAFSLARSNREVPNRELWTDPARSVDLISKQTYLHMQHTFFSD